MQEKYFQFAKSNIESLPYENGVLSNSKKFVFHVFCFTFLGSLGYVSSRSKQNAVHPLDPLYRKLSPNIEVSDKRTSFRRLSLHLRGSIPNVQEWKELENSNEENFESFAVNFLKQPEFAEYWGTKLGAMLRDKTKGKKFQPVVSFNTWQIPFIQINPMMFW